MVLFHKKEPRFISAKCPECQGGLELDANFETAVCQSCGMQCIVENVIKKESKKATSLDKIITFVNHRQDLRRKDNIEKQLRKNEEKKKNEDTIKKYWWIWALVMAGLFVFMGIMSYLE